MNGAVTASFSEGADLLGFEIVLPSQFPEELEAPTQMQLDIIDGMPSGAWFGYSRAEGSSGPFRSMIVRESRGPRPSNFDIGDPKIVTNTTVYLDIRADEARARWEFAEVLFYVDLFADNEGSASSDLLTAEVLRVAESMIQD